MLQEVSKKAQKCDTCLFLGANLHVKISGLNVSC